MNRVFWLLVLSCVVALGSEKCSGAELTVMAGFAQFEPPSDGVYWNVNQPHDMTLTPAAAAIRYDSGAFALQYTYFGTVKVDALAVSVDAPDPGGYVRGEGRCIGTCAPLARWKMQTETQSVALIYVKRFGPWSVEGGANLYETRTKGHVEHLNGAVWNYKEGRYLDVGPMAGLGYQGGPWSVRFQIWRMEGKGTPGDGAIPPAAFSQNYQATLMAGYSF